jgi:5-methylcytosine-specific restriction endonuclease McrA
MEGTMGRPDYFPAWTPQRATIRGIRSYNFRERYKALRNSSSGFIKRPDVRAAVLKKSDYRCVQCGADKELQVDHIVSVYKCARGLFPVEKLNSLDNLQALCSTCNAAKSP